MSDERNTEINLRTGATGFVLTFVFAFVGWVTDNVVRNAQGEPVAFFSPWGLMVFAMVAVGIVSYAYNCLRVSDPAAEAEDQRKRRWATALLGVFVLVNVAVFLSDGDRIAPSVRYFFVASGC